MLIALFQAIALCVSQLWALEHRRCVARASILASPLLTFEVRTGQVFGPFIDVVRLSGCAVDCAGSSSERNSVKGVALRYDLGPRDEEVDRCSSTTVRSWWSCCSS